MCFQFMRMQIPRSSFPSFFLIHILSNRSTKTVNGVYKLHVDVLCYFWPFHDKWLRRLKSNELSILHRTKMNSVSQNDEMRNESKKNKQTMFSNGSFQSDEWKKKKRLATQHEMFKCLRILWNVVQRNVFNLSNRKLDSNIIFKMIWLCAAFISVRFILTMCCISR